MGCDQKIDYKRINSIFWIHFYTQIVKMSKVKLALLDNHYFTFATSLRHATTARTQLLFKFYFPSIKPFFASGRQIRPRQEMFSAFVPLFVIVSVATTDDVSPTTELPIIPRVFPPATVGLQNLYDANDPIQDVPPTDPTAMAACILRSALCCFFVFDDFQN